MRWQSSKTGNSGCWLADHLHNISEMPTLSFLNVPCLDRIPLSAVFTTERKSPFRFTAFGERCGHIACEVENPVKTEKRNAPVEYSCQQTFHPSCTWGSHYLGPGWSKPFLGGGVLRPHHARNYPVSYLPSLLLCRILAWTTGPPATSHLQVLSSSYDSVRPMAHGQHQSKLVRWCPLMLIHMAWWVNSAGDLKTKIWFSGELGEPGTKMTKLAVPKHWKANWVPGITGITKKHLSNVKPSGGIWIMMSNAEELDTVQPVFWLEKQQLS